jgi:leucine dehydrogenase
LRVFEKLAEYRYEQLVFCHDKATGLRAIVAIHDTTLGPALGGCRMYPYAGEDEAIVDVLRLARGMTYKAAASGLNLGGGKSVIIGDPHTDKSEALFRSFGRYIETLGGRYIVAEDVGTSTEDANFIRVETSPAAARATHRHLPPSGFCRGCGPVSRRSSARPHWKAGSSPCRAWGTWATICAVFCTRRTPT